VKRLNPFFLFILVLFSCSNNQQKESNNLFYDKAFNFRENGKADSAFLYFNNAKDLFLKQNDSVGAGKCLVNMGILATDKGDYFGGQEISLNAIPYFDKTKKNQYAYINSNFNNLGLATYRLKDYENSIKFYDLAIEYSTDSSDISLYQNNKANSYRELKKYDEALKIYFQALKGTNQNKKNAQLQTNISITKWLQDSTYNAIPNLLRALHIREKEDDLWGQNSSYSHLSDYYKKKNPDSSLFYATKMYYVAKRVNSPDDELKALQKLIELAEPKATKQYFENYQKLADSLETSRNATKNQFILIRYETEKSKADNLILKEDNAEKNSMLFATVLIAICGLTFLIFWYRKRKQRIDLETQNTIRENQLKTSKKVHDVVANGLYLVMTEIENNDKILKGNILDKIEDLYEKSRDISYEELKFTGENFHQKITALITSFANETTKILLVGNSEKLWQKVNANTKFEIEHILQELMVNMKKHSQANNVVLKFEQKNTQIIIYYVDNGVGMPKGPEFKNGLTNTGNRIESINGAITFDTIVEKGLRIQISFPLS
jgi:tetratricopeptide (TPR) repeat protein